MTPAAICSARPPVGSSNGTTPTSSPPSATKPPTPNRPVYAEYRYDTAGQRVLKIVRKHGNRLAVTTYIGGVFERLTLTSASGTSSHDTLHILDGATRVATAHAGPPLPGDASPPVAYHLGDHLGSSTVVLDSSGALFNREEYTPYGETSFGSYAKKRYRYTGKERDEESGLYYHGARYYVPWLSRWASADPLPKPSQSLYCYAADNPLRMIDSTGAQENPAQPENGPAPQNVAATSQVSSSQSTSGQEASPREGSLPPGTRPDGSTDWWFVLKETVKQIDPFASHDERVQAVNAALERNADRMRQVGVPTDSGEMMMSAWGTLGKVAGGLLAGKIFGPIIDKLFIPAPSPGVMSVKLQPDAPNTSTPTYTPNPNIQPHGDQPSPRPAGMQSHHPEQQTALARNIANYDPDADPALLMPTPQHQATFAPQAAQRALGATFENALGKPAALEEAATIMQQAGVSSQTAGQTVLQHSGYLFSITPANQVLACLPP